MQTKIHLSQGHRLQWEKSQHCMVLLFPEGMIQLNQSSGDILSLCDGSKSESEIIKTLEEKYNTKNIANDIKEFLKVAHDKGWIESK